MCVCPTYQPNRRLHLPAPFSHVLRRVNCLTIPTATCHLADWQRNANNTSNDSPLLRFRLFLVAQVPTPFSQLPQTSAMTSTSQRQKGSDCALSALDVVIQVLSLAKDSCGIPPAQAVFGIANAILSMIRVRFSPLFRGGFLSPSCLGLIGQQTGLCRLWASLWKCIQSTRAGIEGEAIE